MRSRTEFHRVPSRPTVGPTVHKISIVVDLKTLRIVYFPKQRHAHEGGGGDVDTNTPWI